MYYKKGDINKSVSYFDEAIELEQDPMEKAENCYKISVDYGIEEAGLALGKLYLRGINGNKPNPRKARRMLEHCSDEGSAEAASLLGKIYDEGIMG